MSKEVNTQRLDEAVVERGLAVDLRQARGLIMAGQVVVEEQRVDKPGYQVAKYAAVRLKEVAKSYVGRGGVKLEGALADFGIASEVVGATVLDVGASTGGFTDACIKFGARKVYALDVGTNQLAWSLRSHPKVVSLEKVDVRQLDCSKLDPIDMVVVDVSFIGLKIILDSLLRIANGRRIHYLLLVKPQFELRKDQVPEGGVVLSDQLRAEAVGGVISEIRTRGIDEVCEADCRLEGRGGNREVFVYFKS